MSDYPMHEKLAQVQEKSQAIGEFLEFLNISKKFWLCQVGGEEGNHYFFPASYDEQRLIGEFFGIDIDKLEEEKKSMLKTLREAKP
jgi:hypothetical protein